MAEVDAGRVSKEDLFGHADQMLKERLPRAAAHKPAEPAMAAAPPAAPKAVSAPSTATH